MIKYYTLFFMLFGASFLQAQDFKFKKVSKEEVMEKEHPLDKDANAAVLYKSRNTYYIYTSGVGFKMVTEYHERIKIYNKEGFDWATKSIRTYDSNAGRGKENISGLKAYTYNIENGKLVDTKLDKDEIFTEKTSKYHNTTKFTMPALKEGSVIEYEYLVYSPFLTSIDDFRLQYSIPINKLEVKLGIPEYLIFGKYFNLKSPLAIDLKEGRDSFRQGNLDYLINTYEVNMDDIPALKEEPYVDYLQNYAAGIKWELKLTKFPNSSLENYSKTWEGVTKSIYDDLGLGKETDRSGFFEDDVDALLSGVSNPMEKAGLIFQFVKEKVKWNDYIGFMPDNGARKAYKEGVGNTADINLLLTAMLKHAGINASPVLVSTQSNGIPLFPTRNGFNYLISCMETPDGGKVLLDATDPTAGIGELPEMARNWQGRIIKEDGASDWVNLNPNYISEVNNRLNVQIADGKLKGIHFKILNGLHAKKFRKENLSKSEEDLTESIAEDLGNISISDVKVENLDLIGKDIKESYKFESIDGFEKIGDKIYFKPLFFEAMTENPFKADERTYPIFFDFPTTRKKLVNIMIPDGFKLLSAPESIILKLKDDAAAFSFIVHQNGKFVRIESEVRINRSVFSASDYYNLKKFYNSIVEKQNETIVLDKISENGTSERTESGR